MKAIFHTWQHGAWVALAYGAGALMGFVVVAVPLALGTALLEAFGVQVDESAVQWWIWLTSPLWAVFGIGWAARNLSSERLAPDDHTREARQRSIANWVASGQGNSSRK